MRRHKAEEEEPGWGGVGVDNHKPHIKLIKQIFPDSRVEKRLLIKKNEHYEMCNSGDGVL